MKRALAVIVAVTLVGAGCGRDDDSAGDGGDADPPADGGTSGGTDADEPVEGSISVWAMGTEGENLGVLAEDFMAEYPDVSVDVTPVP